MLIVVLATLTSTATALEFAGVPISPGSTVRAEVSLTAAEKSYAADAMTKVPDKAVAVLAIPPRFDPAKVWPVLVVFSTTDFRRLNRDDLVDFYRKAALSEGWVVIAGDGHDFPPHDTNGWRAAMTMAALDALHRSFPQSSRWPVSVAGFSGGAKRASLLAPLLVLDGTHVCGMYLTGVNEDVLSVSYRKSHLGKSFLEMPIFISSGTNDPIAPTDRARAVAGSMKRAGFQSVRFETFTGGHAVKKAHTIGALRWFRESCSRAR
ncbi:MAG: hypothetical protein ACJ8M1_13870 [Chthoniobacterales bacterium]